MLTRRLFISLSISAVQVLSACSHNRAPETDPAALAALRADMRLVGSETTWVARGRGYELVGRSRSDLVAVQPSLDRAASYLAQIYPHDSVTAIVATIRRIPAPGKPFVAAAPIPTESKGERVELVLFDPKAMEEQRKKGDGPRPERAMGMNPASVSTPAIRSWLSARAAKLTHSATRLDQLSGEAGDPRVPAWAIEMIGNAGNEDMIDTWTKSISAHEETLIPLSRFFTMDRPVPMEIAAGRRGGGETQPGGGGVGRGGIGGGRGGMGGGRGGIGGMGGRGGMGGGGRSSGGSGDRSFPLQGLALFTAQSAVLTKYFAHVGTDVVGEMIDEQIIEKTFDAVLARHNLGTLQSLDTDWRGWLVQRADLLNRR
jgi:hypothetical protein